MKVVCINNTKGNARHLTLNQIYNAKEYSGKFGNFFIISIHIKPEIQTLISNHLTSQITDLWVDQKCFTTIEQWRRSQLDKLEL